MNGHILIVDDEPDLRLAITEHLKQERVYSVGEADSGAEMKRAMKRQIPDVVLLDINLPDSNGLNLLLDIKRESPDTQVIVITGQPSYDAAVEATKRGAFHFLTKPFETSNLLVMVERALENKELRVESRELREQVIMSGGAAPIFQSAAMKSVLRMAEKIAPDDVSVLITGESGSGKEVIADLIHGLSPRVKGPLIKVNCAALPRELIESELFGSVKGAYTGAHADREGLFRQAEKGTLFLDEISEMPIDTQSKLLRVLQEKEVRPIGGKTVYQTDCRIVAATNRRPDDAIVNGKLREDLFYRISAITIHLPPLRERRDDIMPIANGFLRRFAAQANRIINGYTPAAIERLRAFDWPGNVRQLQNEIQRAVLLCEASMIDVADLSISSPSTAADAGDTTFTLLEGVERNMIVQVLKETNGNKLETAKRLGIGRQTLYNKIKVYGIDA